MIHHIANSLEEAREGLDALLKNEATLREVERSAEMLIRAFESGNRVFSCGNGGSMSDAVHFAEELSGRFRGDRKALPAAAISDAGHLTCVANDYGYQAVFSRYVEAHARAGDVLLAISTSGSSANVLQAALAARKLDAQVIALTGNPDAELAAHADLHICTPAGQYADRVQELHIKVIHILIELVERRLFPGNY